jgi:hypothetical protein
MIPNGQMVEQYTLPYSIVSNITIINPAERIPAKDINFKIEGTNCK